MQRLIRSLKFLFFDSLSKFPCESCLLFERSMRNGDRGRRVANTICPIENYIGFTFFTARPTLKSTYLAFLPCSLRRIGVPEFRSEAADILIDPLNP